MRPPSAAFTEPLVTGFGWLRTRIEEHIEDHGLAYPWWIPVVAIVSQTGAVGAALAIRDALWPLQWVSVTLLLVVLPGLWMIGFNRHMAHLWETFAGISAAVLLLWNPAPSGTAIDIAPALLALVTCEVVARDGVRNGVVVGLLSLGITVAADLGPGLSGTSVHLLTLLIGFVVGYMLLWQMRALGAERIAREGEHQRATLAERERIAREIHDLVAHSLSVTLLQITGARQALRDVEGDQSAVGEVDDALADAERVGRQAMSDIRQTVSTLADGPADTRALPNGSDIAELVAQMERAGMAIEYIELGDPKRLAQATGLGLYRIAQESLANIAKHAPLAHARVEFEVTSRQARLVVRNAMPGRVASDGRGSGLAGMNARADQLGATLSAAPVGTDWIVDLAVPLRERNGLLCCPLTNRSLWPRRVAL